ncbi:MAG: hypothetical protein IE891_01380 [Flavobacteriaceae bacterium]|nr:hypothetical protein [Flavobacteriaceae bacterium]
MKKSIYYFVFVLSFVTQFAVAQVKILEKGKANETNSIKKEQVKLEIPQNQLATIKETYNWNKEKFLIVNFKGMRNTCNYDIYDDLVNAYNQYEKPAFAKMDLSNCRNVFLYADAQYAKSIIDKKTHYEDVGQYFLKHYFNDLSTCTGVMVINQKGQYLLANEEYSTFTITKMIENLSK